MMRWWAPVGSSFGVGALECPKALDRTMGGWRAWLIAQGEKVEMSQPGKWIPGASALRSQCGQGSTNATCLPSVPNAKGLAVQQNLQGWEAAGLAFPP